MGTTKRSLGIFTLAAIVTSVPFAQTVGSRGFQQERDQAAAGREVTQSDVERWKQELTNWGRWGADDEIGTLNLITPEKRRQAAALVREGVSVSLAHDAETEATIDGPRPYQVIPLGITADEIRISYHGFIHTHLDFLNHNFIGEGVTYNDYRPDPAVVAAQGGHSRNTVHNAKSGIVTRGVLIDMARFRNVPYLEPGTPIHVEDIEAWEAATGVTVSSGDAVVIRTGRWARRAEAGPWDVASAVAGLHASVIPWLKARDIALLGGEAAQDMAPADAEPAVTVADDLGPRPLHRFALIYLGMPLFDNLDLEALAEVAASLNRYEFLLTAAPLPTRGTGVADQSDRDVLARPYGRRRSSLARTSTAQAPGPDYSARPRFGHVRRVKSFRRHDVDGRMDRSVQGAEATEGKPQEGRSVARTGEQNG